MATLLDSSMGSDRMDVNEGRSQPRDPSSARRPSPHAYHEFDTRCGEPIGGCLPIRHGKDDAEMAHGHAVAVDRVSQHSPRLPGREVSDDLVIVEVDPIGRATPIGTFQHRSAGHDMADVR